MNKQMTTTTEGRVRRSGSSTRKLNLAVSSLLGIGGLVSLAVVGFSWTGIAIGIGGLLYGVVSFLLNYVRSGAYLPDADADGEKSLKQKFISLKFRSNSDEASVERCLELIGKKTIMSKRFKDTLNQHFNETEITYARYLNLWSSFEELLNDELAKIYSRLVVLTDLVQETNKSETSSKIEKGLMHSEKLLVEAENLLVSFDLGKDEDDHQEIFNQLKIMSERTKTYLE